MALGNSPEEIINNSSNSLLRIHPSWKRIKLREIADVLNGYAFISTLFNRVKGKPIIRIRDIEENFSDTLYDGEWEEKYIVKKGDFLVGMDGDFKSNVWQGEDALLNQRVCKIALKSKAYSFKFLTYVLQPYLNEIHKHTSSVTVKHLSSRTIEDIPLPLPLINEQHRIIEKIEELFSELDYAIATLKTTQQQLQTYRRSLLFNTFSFKEGWTKGIIEDVCISLDNKRKPINKKERLDRVGTIPYYGANGQTGWIDDYLFDEDLILVVEDETFTGREAPFAYKITGKTWVNNHAHILKPKKELNIDFLNYSLWYYPFTPLTTGTTGRKKLTKYALMNAPYSFPSLKEQLKVVEEIEAKLSESDYLLQTINEQLVKAERLRQSILQRAFSGQI